MSPGFSVRDGALYCEDTRLDEIARAVGTPVYVYSTRGFLDPLRALQDGLKEVGVPHLVCFAVKANSNLSVLRLLGQAGAGADLVSGGELYRATQAGIPADRIVFSGVGKTESEIRAALGAGSQGILAFNVESESELAAIERAARAMNRRAAISLRFNPDVDAKTHPYIATGLKENKFGLSRTALLKLVERFKKSDWISIEGLSIHIGSQILTLRPFEDAFKRTHALLLELNRRLAKPLKFVDLGGGLGVPYGHERPVGLVQYCKLIQKIFAPAKRPRAKDAGWDPDFRVLLEPGRFIAAQAGALVTRVIYRKPAPPREFLITDAGMNDLIRPALYQSHHTVARVLERAKASRVKPRKFELVGPVCETADFLARRCPLPSDTTEGDLLAILSAGAYGFTMSNQYNSRPRAAEVLVNGSSFKIIRQRETYEDLVVGE